MSDRTIAPSFEASLEEIERIVSLMEAGNLPLEESLAAYQQGVTLLRRCEATLTDAEQRIQVLEGNQLVDLPTAGTPG